MKSRPDEFKLLGYRANLCRTPRLARSVANRRGGSCDPNWGFPCEVSLQGIISQPRSTLGNGNPVPRYHRINHLQTFRSATCSNLFHNSNPGPARVCLSRTSVDAAVCEFASFLKVHFPDSISADPRAFKKIVLRLVRRELPRKRALAKYTEAALQHTRCALDAGGKIIHVTPKEKWQQFAAEI